MALSEVEEGDDGSLLVLGRIMGDDFLCTLEVFGDELEGNLRAVWVREGHGAKRGEEADLGVVVRGVTVL